MKKVKIKTIDEESKVIENLVKLPWPTMLERPNKTHAPVHSFNVNVLDLTVL